MLIFGAARADAQITTVIAAPKRNRPQQQRRHSVEQAAQDSIARVTLTGMKQWVDSAAARAGVAPGYRNDAGADTAVAATQPDQPRHRDRTSAPDVASSRQRRATFRDGARAPNTATTVPTIALAGARDDPARRRDRAAPSTYAESRARRVMTARSATTGDCVRGDAASILLIVGWVAALVVSAASVARGAIARDAARSRWAEIEAQRAVTGAREAHGRTATGRLRRGTPVARLVIPRLGLDEVVVEGVSDDGLRAGPGHMTGSALPGDSGNARDLGAP